MKFKDESLLTIRKAQEIDASFLARMVIEAGRSGKQTSMWVDLWNGNYTLATEFLTAMYSTNSCNWGNMHDTLILCYSEMPVGSVTMFKKNDRYSEGPIDMSRVGVIYKSLECDAIYFLNFISEYYSLWVRNVQREYAYPSSEWVIDNIAIDSRYRDRGFGTFLVRSCLDILQMKNAESCELSVTASNKRAINFYKRIGFSEYISFESSFYSIDGFSGMRKLRYEYR